MIQAQSCMLAHGWRGLGEVWLEKMVLPSLRLGLVMVMLCLPEIGTCHISHHESLMLKGSNYGLPAGVSPLAASSDPMAGLHPASRPKLVPFRRTSLCLVFALRPGRESPTHHLIEDPEASRT
jgi:hypothetical protein